MTSILSAALFGRLAQQRSLTRKRHRWRRVEMGCYHILSSSHVLPGVGAPTSSI